MVRPQRKLLERLGFLELDGESFAGAMQLAADGVGGLIGEGADLLVT
jgi:hypothetical protein